MTVVVITGALLLTGFRKHRDRCEIPRGVPLSFEEVARFDVPDGHQGIGVDSSHFYAVNNSVITKHNKETGAEVGRWEWDGDPEKNPMLHMDSAVVIKGRIYASHSNWDDWPMTSSVEVFDAGTMEHIGNHSFGIKWGSMTWLDWHDGYWWGTFANYNRFKPHPDPTDPNGFDVPPGMQDARVSIDLPYGEHKRRTTLVKFNRRFRELEAWVLPDEVLQTDKTANMSNSGGSWGPDGYLYITGHDLPEVYKVKLPEIGSKLELVEVIPLNMGGDLDDIGNVSIRGQGIAWDRSTCGELWGIIRARGSERDEGVVNKVTRNRLVF